MLAVAQFGHAERRALRDDVVEDAAEGEDVRLGGDLGAGRDEQLRGGVLGGDDSVSRLLLLKVADGRGVEVDEDEAKVPGERWHTSCWLRSDKRSSMSSKNVNLCCLALTELTMTILSVR